MVILSKACKPDNFESHNSLKLSFMNIQGLRSNFVDCLILLLKTVYWVNIYKFLIPLGLLESFLESNSPDILPLLRQTWMTQLILAISL